MPRKVRRRHVLRGVGGVVLGLPFLEGLASRAEAQPAAQPRRFAVLWENNGVNMDLFWPATPFGPLTEDSFAPERAIAPLRDYRTKLLVPRGLDMSAAGGHLGTIALTASPPRPYSGLSEMRVAWATGISVDRVMAQRVNPGGRGPLTLRVSRPTDSVYGVLSYRGPLEPVASERNPWIAYRDLIGLGAGNDRGTALLVERRKSVLDLVMGRVDLLRKRQLSSLDRQKLDLHFQAVRDLERDLDRSGLKTCELPAARRDELAALQAARLGDEAMFGPVGRMHLDVIALAFACDLNRVATMMWGSEAGGPTYRFEGLNHTFPHHPLSHGTQGEATDSGAVPNYKQLLNEIDRWHARQVKYLLDRLASYAEGSGSVLDSTLVLWMNSMSNGNAHSSRDMPVVMAGSLGGFFRTGAYVDVRDPGGTRKPHNMLLTTLLQGMGIPETHFGPRDRGRSGAIDLLRA